MVSTMPLTTRKSVSRVRKSYARLPQVEVPNLIEVQTNSFRRFKEEGLWGLFQEISPIRDFSGSRLELSFLDYKFEQPESEEKRRQREEECRRRDMTYSWPLFVTVRLAGKEKPEPIEQRLFFGDFPEMTDKGTFVINGAERVVVSQLIRSPGVYFTVEEDVASGRELAFGKLIPDRGAWLEFETSNKDIISVKVDGKRKIPITTLLRALGYGTDERLSSLFQKEEADVPEHQYIKTTAEREPAVKNEADALIDIYKRLRPGDPPNLENARLLITNLFYNSRRYDLGKVGRYKLNKRLGLEAPPNQRVLTRDDLVEIVRRLILINNGRDVADDIDHLGNRRVRTAGELIQNQLRIGLLRLERVVRERMSIVDPEVATPSSLINIRPVAAAIREFFGGSQLSQFMDQTNPLAELTHKRRLSALGPGGLSRERAGFDVRDVHHSHYGRICPIETPEGPNIGLIGSLATYGRVNEYGFIESPYRKVYRELPSGDPRLVGRTLPGPVRDAQGRFVAPGGRPLTREVFKRLAALTNRQIKVVPFVSDEIIYRSADQEENDAIAQANVLLDEQGQFVEDKVEVRRGTRYYKEAADKVDFMDVSPKQIISVATALIPFLEHNDANRALMGSNMQRQAVPLIRPEAPVVGTGMERQAAKYSGQVVFARNSGLVVSVTGEQIVIRRDDGTEETYLLHKFVRTNQGTCINQRPLVNRGDLVAEGQVLADSSATDQGELALGQNLLCAFMSWEGYNFEDAIVISEELLKNDKFTSIHIEKHEVEARDTKLGPEEITPDIPNVGEESLSELDEEGIIRIGAEVSAGDILVGKITPKGETELTAEEKLLRAIFGEKSREVKDTSLRVPHGERGTVIDVKEFRRENKDELPVGVNQLVRVWVAQKRKIAVGDKMAGRHGNKGVVARILPAEDMPHLPDGRPVDIVLNPIGVPSRMNIGQVLETHLGWAAQTLGYKALCPVFDGASSLDIEDALARAWIARRAGAVATNSNEAAVAHVEMAKAWLSAQGYDGEQVFDENRPGEARRVCLRLWLDDMGINGVSDEELDKVVEETYRKKKLTSPIMGKTMLYDGRTGEAFDQPVTVGSIYMMKLIHLVEDKIHARSTGPYSLITQQPLGGKAQFGGQRFGEMEVWALEAYGAAYNLQELLTVKSDDVLGRAKTYEAIVKNKEMLQPGVPESFKVLVKELQSLGLAVEVLSEEEKPLLTDETEEESPKPKLQFDLEERQHYA